VFYAMIRGARVASVVLNTRQRHLNRPWKSSLVTIGAVFISLSISLGQMIIGHPFDKKENETKNLRSGV
jgi:hypothetical protein